MTFEMAEEQLASLIPKLNTQDFSEHFVNWLRKSLNCDNVAVIAYFQDRNPAVLTSFSNHPSVHAKLYTEYVSVAYLLDPFHDLHIKRAQRGVYRLADIAPDHFQRNQYFITYYRKTTLVDEIAFISYPAKGVSIQTCLGRDSNSNIKFSSKELRKASRIAPIVSAFAETHWSTLSTTGTYLESETVYRLLKAVEKVHGVRITLRQAEVAMFILRGHSSTSIGLQMKISRQTVKVFRRQLYKRLTISSQAELFNHLLPLLNHS